MRNLPILLLISTLALGACQSRLNPINWFGRDEPVPAGTINPLIPDTSMGLFASRPEADYPGTPIAQVKSVDVSRTTKGAVITVVGVAAAHGAFDVRLQPRNDGKPENGVLTFDLLAIQVPGAPTAGPEQAREVLVARMVTTQGLEGVRTIRVVAAQNARQARR